MTSSVWLAIGAVAREPRGREPPARPADPPGLGRGGRRRGAPCSWPRCRIRAAIGEVGALLPLAVGCAAIALRIATLAPPAAADLPVGRRAVDRRRRRHRVAEGRPAARHPVVVERDAEGPPLATRPRLRHPPPLSPRSSRATGSASGRIEAPTGWAVRRLPVADRSRRDPVLARPRDGRSERRSRRDARGGPAAGRRCPGGRDLPEPEAGLAAGILIGLRDRVDRDLAAAFTTAGVSHVVAISGWNIAIVAATVAALAGRLGRRRRADRDPRGDRRLHLFAGASPSVVRAAVMAGVVLLARETGRAGGPRPRSAGPRRCLLLADPALVATRVSSSRSLATGGLIAWATPLDRAGSSGSRGGRVPRLARRVASASRSPPRPRRCPIVLLTFGRLAARRAGRSTSLVVPLVAPAMARRRASRCSVARSRWPAAAGIVATILGLPAWALLTAMCTVDPRGRGAAVRERHARRRRGRSSPRPATALLIVGGPARVAAASRLRTTAAPRGAERGRGPSPRRGPRRRRGRAGRAPWRLAILAVGRGGRRRRRPSRSPTGRTARPDHGPRRRPGRRDPRRGRPRRPDAHRRRTGSGPPARRARSTAAALGPPDRHPRPDPSPRGPRRRPAAAPRAVPGRPDLRDRACADPGPATAAFAQRARPPGRAARTGCSRPATAIGSTGSGSTSSGRTRAACRSSRPTRARASTTSRSSCSARSAGRRFLLTGDVEEDVDPLLADRGLPPVDILKVAHHGSATASTPAFLDAVQPRVAIVSAGAGNPYGHPARSTIERLQGTGAKVLRTDTDGTVSITIDPSGAIDVTASGPRRTSDAGGVRAASTGGIVLARAAVAAPPATAATAPPTILTTVRSPIAWACGIPSSG